MKSFKGLTVVAVLWPALVLAGGGSVIFVDDDCPTPPGTGSSGDPFCTIQMGYDNAADNDEIRVLPGTYAECLLAVGGAQPVRIVADAFLTGADNTTTIIDGTGLCDGGGGAPVPTVVLFGNGSELNGFTVTGGGDSGIFAEGGVAIRNNLIDGNTGPFGGGAYVYTSNCYYGDTTTLIEGNTVTNNTAVFDGMLGAGGDGGGIFVFAVATVANAMCPLTGDSTVTIQDNTVDGNSADNAFGGGIGVQINTEEVGTSDVAIATNIVTNNFHEAGSIGYGGGIWASTYGYGTETLDINNNTVTGNASTEDGGGISAFVNSLRNADHAVFIDNNTIQNNDADGNGGGLDAFMIIDSLDPGQSSSMNVTNNTIDGNTSDGDFGGGGGALATFISIRSTAATADQRYNMVGNTVTNNFADVSGGGVALIVTTDSDPNPGVVTPAPADAMLNFTNNVVGTNDAGTGPGSAVGGGVYVFLQSFGEAFSTANVDLNTIADNASDVGGGGIEVESFTLFDTGGTNEGSAVLNVSNTIDAENFGWGLGGVLPGSAGVISPGGTANLSIDLRTSNTFGNSLGTVETTLNGFVTETGNDSATDPMLAAVTFESTLCRRIGHARSSALADTNLDDTVNAADILDISVPFGANTTRPRYTAFSDLTGDGIIDGDDVALSALTIGDSCP